MHCRLFFVIEFVNGGDLMFHMQRKRRLHEDDARCVGSIVTFFEIIFLFLFMNAILKHNLQFYIFGCAPVVIEFPL